MYRSGALPGGGSPPQLLLSGHDPAQLFVRRLEQADPDHARPDVGADDRADLGLDQLGDLELVADQGAQAVGPDRRVRVADAGHDRALAIYPLAKDLQDLRMGGPAALAAEKVT
jgi:hypothetical protein